MNMLQRIWFDDLPDEQHILRQIGKLWRRAHRLGQRLRSPYRSFVHRSITRYLHSVGNAARDGRANGGYIVWMNPDMYHDYAELRERNK